MQDYPHDVAWYALYFQAVRSRIYNEKNFQSRDTFILEQYKAQCEFPIEHRKDGLWVYSPIELLATEPSLKYMIINTEGALTLDMNVHWSWWTQTSPEDREALKQAILRIIDRGWKIEYCDQVFGLSAWAFSMQELRSSFTRNCWIWRNPQRERQCRISLRVNPVRSHPNYGVKARSQKTIRHLAKTISAFCPNVGAYYLGDNFCQKPEFFSLNSTPSWWKCDSSMALISF